MSLDRVSYKDRLKIRTEVRFILRLWLDTVVAAICMYGVIRFRYQQRQNPIIADIDITAAVLFGACVLILSLLFRTYRSVWRFSTFADFLRLFYVLSISSLITSILIFMFAERGLGFPRSAPVLATLSSVLILSILRAVIAFLFNGDIRGLFKRNKWSGPTAIIIGSASEVHKFIQSSKSGQKSSSYRPVAAITPSRTFHKSYISGIPITSGLGSLPEVFEALTAKYGAPPILIDVDTQKTRRMFHSYEIVQVASSVGARVFRLEPGRNDVFTPLEISDLIERAPRELNAETLRDFIQGRRVLLTGAGGSIGFELMRHIMSANPKRLAMIDISELALFNIRQELNNQKTAPEPERWATYLGNILNKTRMAEIFKAETPEIVIHAAALKHVIFGQENPTETLRTNVLGTKIIYDLTREHKAKSFTLISTDKACKPTNIMGASKRVAELLVLAQKEKSPITSTAAVRFGNVFVSNGSVVHVFQKQIENGGPVKVTHPDVRRYFMTTKEATALVLQAAAYNVETDQNNGHIYTLEMGESVKIVDVARKLIRLKGLVPNRDIDIIFTGLLTGEKLSEDIYERINQCIPTDVDGILNYQDLDCEAQRYAGQMEALIAALEAQDNVKTLEVMARIFPDLEQGL